MTDGRRTALWMIDSDGTDHRALTDATSAVGSPRWSPDGSRLLYVSSEDGLGLAARYKIQLITAMRIGITSTRITDLLYRAGPEMPSRRMRQKWTARNKLVTRGIKMQCKI